MTPPHGARREHGAHPRRDLQHGAVRHQGHARAEPAGAARHHRQRASAISSTHEAHAAGAGRLPRARPEQPLLDLLLPQVGARERRTRCAGRSPPRCGRRSTPPGSRCRRLRRATSPARGATTLLRLGEGAPHLFRGVDLGTIMRGEAFKFSRLGTFLERADNTARILDMKYHVLLPLGEATSAARWTITSGPALLRSVSVLRNLPRRCTATRYSRSRWRSC